MRSETSRIVSFLDEVHDTLGEDERVWSTGAITFPGTTSVNLCSEQALTTIVAKAESTGWYPSGPLFYTPGHSQVSSHVCCLRAHYLLETPDRRLEGFAALSRDGDATLAGHFAWGQGPHQPEHDLLLADVEAGMIDLAILGMATARYLDYRGPAPLVVQIMAPAGAQYRLRALDPDTGDLLPAEQAPRSFTPVFGVLDTTWSHPTLHEYLYQLASEVASQFAVPRPQLVPPPDGVSGPQSPAVHSPAPDDPIRSSY